MKIVLFDFAIMHIMRISRSLANAQGNILLIGIGGSGRFSCAKLASYVQQHAIMQIEVFKSYGWAEWLEDVKNILNYVGTNDRTASFILTDAMIVMEE
mmetsp:Transcript_28823/g.13342  ORF Transcript_28823/g.13342 Transcript_28823/m.13342 type:complete len:98 (+) Transcript_28823:744-1037(+)